MQIGVLALQGGFSEHARYFKNSCLVKNKYDLCKCDALIIPGGESTVINRLIFPEVVDWLQAGKPVLGTCAGAIIMAQYLPNLLTVTRNAYGGQQDSFLSTVYFDNQELDGVFIRAPKIKANLATSIAKLANGTVVGVIHKQQMALAFHPELVGATVVYQYFCSLIGEK